ncbi:hypothetical protein FSHL1_012613 [Fusarium sambucinum]
MVVLYLLAYRSRKHRKRQYSGNVQDLGLVGNQYNIASTISFVSYILYEDPSNIILKKVRVSIWLSFLVLSWGIVMTCMGVVRNFYDLMTCGVLLGLFEVGFFPGVVFIISSCYPSHELQ